MKDSPWCVTLSNYINERLPKVDDPVPPTMVKNPIGGIEKTHRSTTICSFSWNLEAISIKFHPNLKKPSICVELNESYHEIKYDFNTTQNISMKRSKNLYEVREKISKYTPRLVQLFEVSDDLPLPVHLQSKYQKWYNHVLYGDWPYSMHVPNVGTKPSFFGNS